jgi:hypothetical protein
MIRKVRWPRNWTLSGVAGGWSITWHPHDDDDHLDKRTAAVLELGEMVLDRMRDPRNEVISVWRTQLAVVVALAADAQVCE